MENTYRIEEAMSRLALDAGRNRNGCGGHEPSNRIDHYMIYQCLQFRGFEAVLRKGMEIRAGVGRCLRKNDKKTQPMPEKPI
ncbi:MAG: hypothetical protein DRP64_09380 [Verrucomicrobia bacterium]|nr:MAG: hypothetical protein DRP64_09380 [Verrucomicrobiota bacterium]